MKRDIFHKINQFLEKEEDLMDLIDSLVRKSLMSVERTNGQVNGQGNAVEAPAVL